MNPTAPQAVTSRYVTNLLRDGQNHEFVLTKIMRSQADPCGWYFHASVETVTGMSQSGIGVTPEHAVRSALTRHGVTFR